MLRERIENNEQLKENIIKQLDYVINESPQIRDELIQIVKDFSNNK